MCTMSGDGFFGHFMKMTNRMMVFELEEIFKILIHKKMVLNCKHMPAKAVKMTRF